MDYVNLFFWALFYFTSCGGQFTLGSDGTWIHCGKKTSQWKKCCSGKCLLLQNALSIECFCWETIRSIHVDVSLTHGTYICCRVVYPKGSGIFQMENTACHSVHIVWGTWQGVWGVDTIFKFLRSQWNLASVQCAGSPILSSRTSQLKDIKNLLLPS